MQNPENLKIFNFTTAGVVCYLFVTPVTPVELRVYLFYVQKRYAMVRDMACECGRPSEEQYPHGKCQKCPKITKNSMEINEI